MRKDKKLLLTLAAILLCIFASSAQTHYTSRIYVGAKGGVDLSRMFFNPSVKQVLKPGAMFGFMFRYVEERNFGLLAEVNFMQRGWKENFEKEPFSYSRNLDYLQIPVMAHIYFGRRGKCFLNIGPEIGFRLSDKVHSSFDATDVANISNFPRYHETMQYTEEVRQRVDYGICAGLGGEFSINPFHSINLEARFYYGLGNLFGSSKRDNFNASNSMALEITLGYWFRVK